MSALEARALGDTTDIEAQLRLAEAYRSAGRQREALVPAQRALTQQPANARAALLLGATREDLGEFAEARVLYERALQATASARVRSQLQSRLLLVQRRETQAFVKDAVAREAELSSGPSQPRTVAVFPFGGGETDSLLAPLGRALTAMLITDLSQTSRLTVLERQLVQLLLDEIRLGESGAVDERTAARGGRMLRAERIVQGSMVSGENQLRLEAAVVQLGSLPGAAKQGDRGVVSEADRLEQLFDMEKRLALKLYAAMGVELTPAELAQVNQRRTENLQALLAYGRGLQAADAGQFVAALRYFTEAAKLDPGFAPAREQVSATRALVSASSISTEQLAVVARQEATLPPPSPAALVLPVSPMQRDPVVEVLGSEGVIARTLLELIIRRPGGTP